MLTPRSIKPWNNDTEHNLAREIKSCCVLYHTAASIKGTVMQIIQ